MASPYSSYADNGSFGGNYAILGLGVSVYDTGRYVDVRFIASRKKDVQNWNKTVDTC
jgi:hypothetical protein